MTLRNPIEHVCALYDRRQGELEERDWSLADVYLELGGGGPRSSELHARFADFFNGQTRAVLTAGKNQAKLDYWAGIPERGAALRDEALKMLSRDDDNAVGGLAQDGLADGASAPRPDPRTRSLILAHNQIDAELHAYFAGAAERDHSHLQRPSAWQRGTAVCVLGMSRSGTSLTTRTLNLLGVDLGSEDELMEPAAANNPAGFWEHGGIADLNEDILATLGDAPRQRWRFPPPLTKGWEDDPGLAPHRRAARSMLERSFAGAPVWGWKDPRNCLTLPFWQSLVPTMHYVVCVRHPLDIAASLEARDGMPRDEAIGLWQLYMSSAIAHTEGHPRIFVSYEGYFPNWESQVARLAEFLDLPSPSPSQCAAISADLDERLWHHRDASQDAATEPGLPREARDLYRRLTELVAQT